MSGPVIHSIKRTSGIAGQVSFAAAVQYHDEATEVVTFVGQIDQYGPVVMITPAGTQLFVTDPGRHGKFSREWVRRFFE